MLSFYKLYEELFGSENCTYTTHVICSHLLQIRGDVPLTENSAFIFENFYSDLRHSFVPGTPSPLKQMFQQTYLKRILSHHACQLSVHYNPSDTKKESNSIVYTYQNETYNFYKISQINSEEVQGYRLGRYPASFPELPEIKWENVGIFEGGGLGSKLVTIKRDEIAGKALKVTKYLITCPINVLREK